MGARQRAQQRPKKSPKSKSTPGTSQKTSSSLSQDLGLDSFLRAQAPKNWQDYSGPPSQVRPAFSLSQEARNTEKHGTAWAFSSRLRDNKVAFVSAGNLMREDEQQDKIEDTPDDAKAPNTEESSNNSAKPESKNDDKSAAVMDNSIDAQVERLHLVGHSSESTLKSVPRRTLSNTSIQSDEIIVFAGRQGSNVASRKPTPSPGTRTPQVSGVANAADHSQTEFQTRLQESNKPSASLAVEQKDSIPATAKPNRRSQAKGIRSNRRQQEIEEEEALMQDYIDNMVADDDVEGDTDGRETDEPRNSTKIPFRRNENYRYYDGVSEDNVKVQTTGSREKKMRADLDMTLVWDSDDLEDFENLSTTDSEVDEVGQILRQRRRPSGMQYLVTAVGKGTGDAQWVVEEKLKSASALRELRIWREIHVIEHGNEDDDSGDSSSDSAEEEALKDLVDDLGSEDDENAKILERTARMSDEQIARVLAKQEELGLGSDEVLMFDGGEQDEFQQGDEFISFSIKKHTSSRGRAKRNRRTKDTFPSAGAFADALDEDPYGAFDVMDFDRPSLKPKRKGRNSDLPFELEEENGWRDHFKEVWSKDRDKKSARKAEREEIRLAGMLGSNSKPNRPDLQVRYANSSMDAAQIKAEIRIFLVQEYESLSLGSMEASMRASVHRLAKTLSLKSHSQGAGNNRHPILVKTPHTPHYTIDTVWEIDALVNQRRFFPKNGGSYKNTPKGTPGSAKLRRGGGGTLAGTSYMDGEVVGASAPEIGAGNRGRAMLEKMGWSSGMGIGALGNEGSTDVIKHVVKNTKAGLG